MTNAAYTPGPWSYNRDEGGFHGHVISTGDYIISELPDAGDGASPDTEANARLIATAPELLEALEGLVFSLSPRKIVPVLKAAGYSSDIWKMAHRHARAIIAKAKQ